MWFILNNNVYKERFFLSYNINRTYVKYGGKNIMDRGHKGGFRKDFWSRDFWPREMHKATCSECGQECEVPFKPTEGKPVYCKECYRKRRKF